MSRMIAENHLQEIEFEMGLSRKCLEIVPEDRLGWTPHERSMTLGRLASHIAEAPAWSGAIFAASEFDLMEAEGFESADLDSRAAILDLFDQSVAACREALGSADDATYGEMWTFKKGGQVVMQMPRVAAVRVFVFHHNVHHRAQLGVYLRLCGVPVPAIYGPSADDEGM